MAILNIKELSYRKNQQQILRNVNLSIEPGRVVGLLGANGAGKTTLMRLIAGSSPHYNGTITVQKETAPTRRSGLVSYSAQLVGVDQSTSLGRIAKQTALLYPDFDLARYEQIAQALGLTDKQKLKRLSKGNQRKFALAVTMARSAVLYLLDEPFDGIDVMTRHEMMQSILSWQPEEATVLISDHHVEDIAALLDQVVVIKDETVVAQVEVETIREDGQSVEEYFTSFYADGRNNK